VHIGVLSISLVEKIIKPIHSNEPEMAQIAIEEAEHLYREVRVENLMTDDKGGASRLKVERRLT